MRRCLELVFLLTTLLLTSCSGSSEKKYDLIAADPEWTSTVTFGKAPNLQGFTFDLVTAIAQSQKLSIKLFDTTTDRLIPDLDRNLYVASLSTLSTTEENRAIYTFSDPILPTGLVLVVPANSKITSLKELSWKEVGYNGSIAATRVLAQQQNVLSKPYSNIAKALEDLQNQNIEGVVMDYLPAIGYCNNLYKNILKIVPQLLTDESIHLVTLRKSPTPLTEKFNAGLQAMRENGSYEALRDKWKLK